eukprot:TRINITY_DN23763_c0_g1_i1.p1 TRINITY_DN23763_c0_g1~~TRINITY_DN23763_c0_g1_i1.p1  ORF type:complete len:260 (+),score=46.35 TRINITY_DN23763_c0_g1_i1:76-855(+)
MAGDPLLVGGEGGAEPEFTEAQIQESQRLMEELPRIESALKNFLSLRLAEARTADKPADANAAPSSSAVQGCARVVLKALNALVLPPAPQWSSQYPQGAQESGCDFMERIAHYKVVQALWERCQRAGQKPAKLLGRSALRVVYREVTTQLSSGLASSAAAAGSSTEHLLEFIEQFGATIDAAAAENAAEGDASLVWTSNMNATLAARQSARKEEAAKRVERAANNEGFVSELRAAIGGSVTAEDGSGGSSGPRIEEVEE